MLICPCSRRRVCYRVGRERSEKSVACQFVGGEG